MAKEQAVYSHGHHESVVKSHARRTAQNSMAFLLTHIKQTDSILDVGCGPGSITSDVARLVPHGKIIGGDAAESVVAQATELAAQQGLQNLTFQTFDANALPFPDNSFDVVFCHQVLQHVKDPVKILKEMRRVSKSGGLIAARDADYRTFAWYPESTVLEKWSHIYDRVAKVNGGQPNAGRYMHAWAREAGFTDSQIEYTWTTWHYAGDDAAAFAESWRGRALHSGFATTAMQHGLASDDDLQEVSQGWPRWAQQDGAFIRIPNGEILCRKDA